MPGIEREKNTKSCKDDRKMDLLIACFRIIIVRLPVNLAVAKGPSLQAFVKWPFSISSRNFRQKPDTAVPGYNWFVPSTFKIFSDTDYIQNGTLYIVLQKAGRHIKTYEKNIKDSWTTNPLETCSYPSVILSFPWWNTFIPQISPGKHRMPRQNKTQKIYISIFIS